MTFGQTLRDLAAHVGIHFTYISKMVNGKLEGLPIESLIRSIARQLGADSEELLDLAGNIDGAVLQCIVSADANAARVLQ